MDEYIRDYEFSNVDTYVVDEICEFENKFYSLSDNSLNIFHLNIRSISENLDELVVYLQQLKKKFDLIVLSETFRLADLSLHSLPGYDILYNWGKVNRNDGVVVYIRDTIKYEHEIIGLDNINLLKISLDFNKIKCVFSCVYRLHPTCPYVFSQNLHSYLKTIGRDVDVSVFLGDININILDQKEHTQAYLNVLHQEGYISQINGHTRIQGDRKSCIDHIFMKRNSVENFVAVPFIIRNQITDHFPTILLLDFAQNLDCNHGTKSNSKNRNLKFVNYSSLIQALQNEKWNRVYNEKDVHIMSEVFLTRLQDYIRENTTTKQNTISKPPRKSWITSGLLKSIEIKNQLYKKTLQYAFDTEIKIKYNSYKNLLKKLIKYSKSRFYTKQLNKDSSSTKILYETVKKICNPGNESNHKKPVERIKLEDGTVTTDKQEIVDMFNQHYADVGKKLASKIRKRDDNILGNIPPVPGSIFLKPVIETELLALIGSLKNKKSPGFDGINSSTLKRIKNQIVKPLTYIINEILAQGIWPRCFGIGVVRPIFKSGDALDVNNYRPITLISNIAKIAEKVINLRVTDFLNKHNIMSDSQYGFRKARSSQDAICCLTDNIYKALDGSVPTLCIFVDLAKAFDTVDHKILLSKLEKYGFRGSSYTLFETYLNNRVQKVQIGNAVSCSLAVNTGVPQGTVLGPLLFTLYINDIFMLNSRGRIISYADDTAVIYSDNSWEGLHQMVSQDFSLIKKYFDDNLLTMNAKKTTFLTFSVQHTREAFDSFCLDDKTIIKSSQQVKYLGIIIDRSLRWNLHSKQLVNKIRGLLSKFRTLRQYLNIQQLRVIYYALVQSQLAYGIVGWGGAYDANIKNLEIVQKWLLRVILCRSRLYSSDKLYEEAGVFDIRQLYCYTLLIRQYTNRNNIKSFTHGYPTRQRDVLCRTIRCKKTVGQRSSSYIEQKLFNVAPKSIKEATNFVSYARMVKKWIYSKPRDFFHNIVNLAYPG